MVKSEPAVHQDSGIGARLRPIGRTLRPLLERLGGRQPLTVLLLSWPVAIALALAASGLPRGRVLAGFVLGVVLAQALVAGTPLAVVLASTSDASRVHGVDRWLRVLVLLLLVGLFGLGGSATLGAGLVGLGLWACGPLVLRCSYLAQLQQALVLVWGVVLAFACVGDEPWQPLMGLCLLACLLWATACTLWWAMARRADDLAAGIKSTAILLGDLDWVAQGMLLLGAAWAWLQVAYRAELGAAYFAGLGPALLIQAWVWWRARDRKPSVSARAGNVLAWAGGLIPLGIALALALQPAA